MKIHNLTAAKNNNPIQCSNRSVLLKSLVGLAVCAALSSTANAAVFNVSDADSLNTALATVNSNGADDVIDLQGNTIRLNDTISIVGDSNSITFQNGTLERVSSANPFQLVNIGGSRNDAIIIMDNMTFIGGLATASDNETNDSRGGGAIFSSRELELTNVIFRDNQVMGNGAGGAINSTAKVTIKNGEFRNNVAEANDLGETRGGAIDIRGANGVMLTIENSIFTGNKAGRGGAIFTDVSTRGLRIEDSFFADNEATVSLGGAVWAGVSSGNPIEVENSTFLRNNAQVVGGAFYTQANTSINFNHVTFASNTAGSDGFGQGSAIRAAGTQTSFTMNNSLIADTAGDICLLDNPATLSGAGNLLSDNSCGGALTLGGSEPLTPQEINGLFLENVQSIAGPLAKLSPGSVAIDNADTATCAMTDQRGVARPDGMLVPNALANCDVGSFELMPPPICDGLEATVYVQYGIVVGGRNNGRPYLPNSNGVYRLRGTSGDDVIYGTNRGEIIAAFDGDDVICSLDGDDMITGGAGDDIVFAGAGEDIVVAGQGNDTVFGSTGNDTLRGGPGNDILIGEAGDDTLTPGGGIDEADGGTGINECLRAETATNCASE